jgi:Protein of unknown function (DUF2490)
MKGSGACKSRIVRAWPCLAALVLLATPGLAATADNYAGAWLGAVLTDPFPADNGPSRWRYWLDAQARYPDFGSGARQYLLRPAIGYDVAGSLRAWVGYARLRTESGGGAVADENRYWQQLDWTAAARNGSALTMRARLEERNVSVGKDVALVLRYRVQYDRPLGTGQNHLLFSVEPFFYLGTTDWAGDGGLKASRIFAGVERPLSPHLSLTAGYLNSHVWSDTSADRVDHLAYISFRVKL